MSTLSDKLNLSLSDLNKLSSSSPAYEQMLKEMASYYEKLAKSSEAQAQLLGLEYLKKLDEYNAFKVANKISAASEMMKNILKIIGFSIACIAVLAVLSFAAYKIFGRFKQFFVETLQKWRTKKLQKDLILISKVFKRDDDYKEEIAHELKILVLNGSTINDTRLNFTCLRNQEFSNFYIPACKAAKEKFQMNEQGSIPSLEQDKGYLITSVGAPGLGKSHLTKQLCQYFAGKKDKSGCAYLELSIGQFVPSEKGLTRDDIENKFRTNMAAIFETIKSLKKKLNETKTPLVITITELDKFLGSENLMKIPRGTFVDIFFNNFINQIADDSNDNKDKEIFKNTFFTIDSNVKLENTSYFSEEYLKKYYDLQIQNLQDNKESNSVLSDLLNFTKNLTDGNFNLGQKKGEIEQKIVALKQEKENELAQLKIILGMFKSRARGFDFEFERLNKENFISALIDINDHNHDIDYESINKIMDKDRKNGENYSNSELSEHEKQKIKNHFLNLNGKNYDSLTTDQKNQIDNKVYSFEKAFNKLVNEEEGDINKEKFARIFLRSILEFNLEQEISEKINNESDFKEFGEKNIKKEINDQIKNLYDSKDSEIQNFNKKYKIISNLIEALENKDYIARISSSLDDDLPDDIDDIKEDIELFNYLNKKDFEQINKEINTCSFEINFYNEIVEEEEKEFKKLIEDFSVINPGILKQNNNNNVNLLNYTLQPIINFVKNHLDYNQGNQNNNQQILNNKPYLDDLKTNVDELAKKIINLRDSIKLNKDKLKTLEEKENFLNYALLYCNKKDEFFHSLSKKYSQKLKDLNKEANDIVQNISSEITGYAQDLLNNSFFTDKYKKDFIKSLEDKVIYVNKEYKENKIYFRNFNSYSFKEIPSLDPDKIDKKEFFSIREAQSFFSPVSSFFTKKPEKKVKTRRPSLFWSIAFKGTIVLLGLLNISSIFLFDEKILNTVKSIVDSLLRFVDKQNLFQYSRFFEIGFIVLFAIILLKIEMMIAEYIYSQDNQTSMMKDFRSFISEARKALFKNTAEIFKENNSIPNRVLFVTVSLGFIAADVAIILNSHKILPIFQVCTEKFLNLINKPNLFEHFDKFNLGFICIAALFVLLIEAAITYRLSENVELNAKFFEYESAENTKTPQILA